MTTSDDSIRHVRLWAQLSQQPRTIPLFLPDLPLERGEHLPLSGDISGCIADASCVGTSRHPASTPGQQRRPPDLIPAAVGVGNTDDHAKNHAAFWDGASLQLTPAYDICPQLRSGNEVRQAMAYGSNGDRSSQVTRCAQHAGVYHLDGSEAAEIVDLQISAIRDNWREVCDLAQATEADRDRFQGRQFLNEHALKDWR